MNFEPRNFFIGLMDFFAILLPGALLTFALYHFLQIKGLDSLLEGAMIWAFLFFSYFFGHFIYHIGAWVMDGYVYETIRSATYDGQVYRLSNGKKLSSWLSGKLSKLMKGKNPDKIQKEVLAIKEKYFPEIYDNSAIKAYQWSKARLTLENPQALEHVQRFEADSKFFRSILVVLLSLIPFVLFEPGLEDKTYITLSILLFILLALIRYMNQRLKAINQAYWYIITIEANKTMTGQAGMKVMPAGTTHAGGVVFKKGEKGVEYLLVEALKKKGKKMPLETEWVLPKGHRRPGEALKETAVREVQEETGVWARVIDLIGESTYKVKKEVIKVRFYLMEFLVQGDKKEARKQEWCSYERALEMLTYPEAKDMIKAVHLKHFS